MRNFVATPGGSLKQERNRFGGDTRSRRIDRSDDEGDRSERGVDAKRDRRQARQKLRLVGGSLAHLDLDLED